MSEPACCRSRPIAAGRTRESIAVASGDYGSGCGRQPRGQVPAADRGPVPSPHATASAPCECARFRLHQSAMQQERVRALPRAWLAWANRRSRARRPAGIRGRFMAKRVQAASTGEGGRGRRRRDGRTRMRGTPPREVCLASESRTRKRGPARSRRRCSAQYRKGFRPLVQERIQRVLAVKAVGPKDCSGSALLCFSGPGMDPSPGGPAEVVRRLWRGWAMGSTRTRRRQDRCSARQRLSRLLESCDCSARLGAQSASARVIVSACARRRPAGRASRARDPLPGV